MNARADPTLFIAIGSSTRRRIEAAVEQLLALLDQLDGDADLEPDNDDEPSLGWADNPGRGSTANDYYPDPGDDLEQDRCDDEDGGDAEPDSDAEADPAEAGIADADALDEVMGAFGLGERVA